MINTEDIPFTLPNYEKLLKKYRPLIISQINKYMRSRRNSELEFEDLWQEGSIALYKAIKGFNPEVNVNPGIYLKTVISHQLRYYVRHYLPHYWKKNYEKTLQKGFEFSDRISVTNEYVEDNLTGINAIKENETNHDERDEFIERIKLIPGLKWRTVMILRFVNDLSCEKIGKMVGWTKQSISRICLVEMNRIAAEIRDEQNQ